jgi:hypothetical protein
MGLESHYELAVKISKGKVNVNALEVPEYTANDCESVIYNGVVLSTRITEAFGGTVT